MPRKKRKSTSKKDNGNSVFYGLTLIVLLVGLVAGMYAEYFFELVSNDKTYVQDDVKPIAFEIEEGTAYISVPAVSNSGEGVSTLLAVKAEPGTGKTLVDIDSLLFWVDTQNSIRMAKKVAENITNLSTDGYDMTFSVMANASLIGGESAGAALALASIAALTGETLREDVMITGTVNHDGSIGPIGGVLEKAMAAKQVNVKTFLVPLLQSNEITYDETEHCEKFGLMEWCTTERIPKQVNIGDEAEIEVIEVGTIKEAYNYFIIKEDS
jgi:uncharacterized protein